ncbi:hypothetical protein [Sporosarcina psychrophila]|uniref:Uncharacterized protein n=1 Tax=Sporosarcina psychrophila TaxID=1476 RepID=A0ABV2KCU2_SPOPS
MLKKTAVQKALGELMEDRINKVAWNKALDDEFYVESDNERNIALELLSESMTTDRQRHLLNNLESAWHFVEGLMQEYAYRQGLQDSQMIHEELREFGVFVTKG